MQIPVPIGYIDTRNDPPNTFLRHKTMRRVAALTRATTAQSACMVSTDQPGLSKPA